MLTTCPVEGCQNDIHGWWCLYERTESATHFRQSDPNWGPMTEAYVNGARWG